VSESGLSPIKPEAGFVSPRQLTAGCTRDQRKFAQKVLPFVEQPDRTPWFLEKSIEELGLIPHFRRNGPQLITKIGAD
jgi:hypothetical protein